MQLTTMRHPGVEGAARMPASAVPHWERRGWEVVDDAAPPSPPPAEPEPAPPASPDAPEVSAPESSPEVPRSIRRRPSPEPEESA
jgi:hypothetical protein